MPGSFLGSGACRVGTCGGPEVLAEVFEGGGGTGEGAGDGTLDEFSIGVEGLLFCS